MSSKVHLTRSSSENQSPLSALTEVVSIIRKSRNYQQFTLNGRCCPSCGKGNMIGNGKGVWCPECSFEIGYIHQNGN